MSRRRLAAILSINVVGHSRMMQTGAAPLLAALNEVFRHVVSPRAERANDRMVKLLGDGCLVEFGSAGDAVECGPPIVKDQAAAMRTLMTSGWDYDYPSLRDHLALLITPLASKEQLRPYAEDMREMISPENLGRYREVIDNLDVTGMLGQVTAPCLVMHGESERMHPIEQGRKLAAGLPNARFIAYDSPNHVFTQNDPCWPLADREIAAFLNEHAET